MKNKSKKQIENINSSDDKLLLSGVINRLCCGYFWNSFNPKYKEYGRLCTIKDEDGERLYVDLKNIHWDNFQEGKE
jgi:hypothetical protein